MAARFTVLGSGSGGNASFLEAGSFGLLLDIGFGPRQLATRLDAAGPSWRRVGAVLLTHTHTDHWNERTLRHLRRQRIPFICHSSHAAFLETCCTAFSALAAESLVRTFDESIDIALTPGLRARPLPLCHDGGATFGFRVEGNDSETGSAWSLGYAADLGSWSMDLVQALCDVDLLAIEFNHDVEMEYQSGRSSQLIARVLGDAGHLSNEQAAALLHTVLRQSRPGRPRHVVQLHLSRECNHPRLAHQAALAVLDGHAASVTIHTASQHQPTRAFTLDAQPYQQALLPGWE